jgi:chromate transporter
VGGGTAVLPEMQTLVDSTYHLTAQQFLEIYSLGQLAPGPNMLMVLVLGDRIAGWLGALIVLIAFFAPASILCFWAGRLWNRVGESPWRRAVQDGMAPISIGLMVSGIYALGRTAITDPQTLCLTLTVAALLLLTRLNPVLLILACGLLGLGLFQSS